MSNGGENMQREAGGVRIVDGDEFNARIHQRRDKRQIPGQSVQLRYYKARLPFAAKCQRLV
jgi:hypothetical protein